MIFSHFLPLSSLPHPDPNVGRFSQILSDKKRTFVPPQRLAAAKTTKAFFLQTSFFPTFFALPRSSDDLKKCGSCNLEGHDFRKESCCSGLSEAHKCSEDNKNIERFWTNFEAFFAKSVRASAAFRRRRK